MITFSLYNTTPLQYDIDKHNTIIKSFIDDLSKAQEVLQGVTKQIKYTSVQCSGVIISLYNRMV